MDVKTEEIDFDRAAKLLNVVHLCAGVGPKLTNLGNAAMTELTKLNDTIKAAAQEAELERRRLEDERLAAQRPSDPTAMDVDEDKKDVIKPRAFPSTQTETIADNNIGRRV